MSDLIIIFCERYSHYDMVLYGSILDQESIQTWINLELGVNFSVEEAIAFFNLCLESYPFQ